MRTRSRCVAGMLVGLVVCAPAAGQGDVASDVASADAFTLQAREVADPKAVFATVESADIVPARARIAGTLAELSVDEGDRVEAGAVVAVVASATLALQIEGINARIEALAAEEAQAQIDLARTEDLAGRGVVPRARLDEARTQAAVIARQLDEARAERDVLVEQVSEGAVAAPTAGRVLAAPVTVGTVVLPGEAVARIAAENYVLRLSLPERHARFIAEGDEVRVDAPSLGAEAAPVGRIVQVYPQIVDGRVIADAAVEGLGDFFVGERVRVWVETDTREVLAAPARFVSTRHGIDLVRVRGPDGDSQEVRVQVGRTDGVEGTEDAVELLSGVAPGDVLLAWDDEGVDAASAP